MTRDDIIRMAREAGIEVHPRKQQIRIGFDVLSGCDSTDKVERFAALVAAAEREACAQVCDEQASRSEISMLKAKSAKARDVYSAAGQTAHWMAQAIRARSQA